MVRLDLDYVANRSLGRDLRIIGKTVARGSTSPRRLLKPGPRPVQAGDPRAGPSPNARQYNKICS